jgi:hypothetical protein
VAQFPAIFAEKFQVAPRRASQMKISWALCFANHDPQLLTRIQRGIQAADSGLLALGLHLLIPKAPF